MILLRAASALFTTLVFAGVLGWLWVSHPSTPRAWNPAVPLRVSDPVTPLTGWKLSLALRRGETCIAAMDIAGVELLPPLRAEDGCGIDPRVRIARIGETALAPVETDCRTALRLSMWQTHAVSPAAKRLFGTGIARIEHLDSYNCRMIRTPAGEGGRLSTHATAEAIDITGFVLADGQRVSLIADWDGTGEEAAFLRAVRDGACRWFRTTLGPDYNSLHADHFHLQSRGWGLCR